MYEGQQLRTVQQHILHEQTRFPGATGEFSWLLSGITLAAKMIQSKVRRAGLTDLLGSMDQTNVQGEVQQKLDVYSNEALMHCLSLRQSIGILASEENERPITVNFKSPSAKYAVIFDPLDGSSNIDVNVSVGTTFSILRRPEGEDSPDVEKWGLQPGATQVAAGYVGNGVHGFTLEPGVGAFLLSHESIKMPSQGTYYSTNEGYVNQMPAPYPEFIQDLRQGKLGRPYSARYIGSMVADFHRPLLKGGIFLYPPTEAQSSGKLRLLYEANPIAFIAEQAGGIATDGNQRILDIQPTTIHQRTPLVVGSQVEMQAFANAVPAMAESVD